MTGVQPLKVQEMQAAWLEEWFRYLVSSKAPACKTALEVGCGSGLVMGSIGSLVDVKGVDLDPEQVHAARNMGLDVIEADGASLPFPDRSMDLVYCCFYMMWVNDVEKALLEMVRVARKKVLVMAEPVYSGSFTSPPELGKLVQALTKVIVSEGGRPDSGTKVLTTLRSMGLHYRFGTVPTEASPSSMSEQVDLERAYVRSRGIDVSDADVDIFFVPRIWASVDI